MNQIRCLRMQFRPNDVVSRVASHVAGCPVVTGQRSDHDRVKRGFGGAVPLIGQIGFMSRRNGRGEVVLPYPPAIDAPEVSIIPLRSTGIGHMAPAPL